MSITRSFLLGAAALTMGCAQALPPAALVDARAAYERAAAGPAAELDPAALHVAEEQLAAAEQSFDRSGDTYKTRDIAYVAERKAELADVQGHTLAAEKQTADATQHLQAARAKSLALAEAQLAQARERIAATTAAMAELAAMNDVRNVKHDARGTVITLSGSVLFASAKYELLPSAEGTLTNVAAALAKSDPETHFVVQGFTDSQGPEEYNRMLSQNRAETVRSFLISHGIAGNRVTAEGFGPASPVASNSTPEGRANNRRVEILVQNPPVPSETSVLPTGTETTTTTTIH